MIEIKKENKHNFFKICFAYKTRKAITQLNVLYTISGGTVVTIRIPYYTINDNQWHYNCTDMNAALKAGYSGSYVQSSVTIFEVSRILSRDKNVIITNTIIF